MAKKKKQLVDNIEEITIRDRIEKDITRDVYVKLVEGASMNLSLRNELDQADQPGFFLAKARRYAKAFVDAVYPISEEILISVEEEPVPDQPADPAVAALAQDGGSAF